MLIIGDGTGGLCLAQGLKKSVAVQVFERDRTPTSQMLGYWLSISETDSRALRDCLPAAMLASQRSLVVAIRSSSFECLSLFIL